MKIKGNAQVYERWVMNEIRKNPKKGAYSH